MSFYTDVIKKDPRFNSTNICRDVALLEPGFRAKVQALLEKAHEDGHDIRIAETFRSQAIQAQLFEQGYTQLKKVGVHNYGLACDFNLFVNGKYETDGQEYSFLLGYGKELKFISGIDWGTPWQKHTFHDWDHIKMCQFSGKQLFLVVLGILIATTILYKIQSLIMEPSHRRFTRDAYELANKPCGDSYPCRVHSKMVGRQKRQPDGL